MNNIKTENQIMLYKMTNNTESHLIALKRQNHNF